MSRLTDVVREARKSAGLSQAQLAARLGMTQDNYNKLETGKRGISDQMLQKLADIEELGLTVDRMRALKLLDENGPEIIKLANEYISKVAGPQEFSPEMDAIFEEATKRRAERKKK